MQTPGMKLLCAFLLTMPGLALAAGPGCDNVNFSAEVIAKFPNAQKACIAVVEKEGGIYVKYEADVISASKDSVTVDFLDSNGKGVSRVTFAPAADQTAEIDGKKQAFASLKKGMKLHFYIEHSRWGLYANPAARPMKILSSESL